LTLDLPRFDLLLDLLFDSLSSAVKHPAPAKNGPPHWASRAASSNYPPSALLVLPRRQLPIDLLLTVQRPPLPLPAD
jgi:hypothetical protein